MFGLHQRSVDGHEAPELKKADGRSGEERLARRAITKTLVLSDKSGKL
jgi:hypothetical protein